MSEELSEPAVTLSLEQKRARLGLRPLPSEGRDALEGAMSRSTPAASRLAEVLELGVTLGADVLSSEEVDAWTRALARIDALAYCVRLIEAQILAGNEGLGMMLPDTTLEVDLP
jgi:hypothetical protein